MQNRYYAVSDTSGVVTYKGDCSDDKCTDCKVLTTSKTAKSTASDSNCLAAKNGKW